MLAPTTIAGYYRAREKQHNPSDPACPKAVDIPSTIGGEAVNVIGELCYGQRSNQLA